MAGRDRFKEIEENPVLEDQLEGDSDEDSKTREIVTISSRSDQIPWM
jgi:hypothetical protein